MNQVQIMPTDRGASMIGPALIILAVLVQLQTTIEIDGTEVRANAADIALAMLAPVILFALYSSRDRLREIAGTQLPVLLVVATLLLSFSLFRGYEVISGLSSWAAIKYAGWYILLYYMALGALIATVAPRAGYERFALGLICFQVAVIVAFIFMGYAGLTWGINLDRALTGFVGNPNAMAFNLICGFAMALAYLGRKGLKPRWRLAVFVAAGVLLAGILFTKSVASLIALASVLLFAAIIRAATIKRLAQVLALGLSLWMTPQFIVASQSLLANVFLKLSDIVIVAGAKDQSSIEGTRYQASVQLRMEGYWKALSMWREQPVFGAGLGVYFHHQNLEDKPEIFILQIHNTALWLLAEMGLAGFCAMAGIFVLLFHKVWCLARSPPGNRADEPWFATAVLLILVAWATMSLFHELMYQRLVWLLAGMALSAPVEPLSLWKHYRDRRSAL